MRYLSLCSGIEAASAAWHHLGWEPAAFSEIEPFPSAVLAHHYPHVPNVGCMTKYKEWDLGGTIELLVGGTPCQAFSVAGLRKGLEDARGNLSLTFCEIADHFNPEWILWENVPGVLSSQDNAFGCFLAGLCGASEPLIPDGRWASAGVVSGSKRTVAWRVCDAQYFGVAQRRRRVFVLAVPGSSNWKAAAALFPVGESVFWDSAPSRDQAKDASRCSRPSLASGKPTTGTLMANAGTKLWLGNQEAFSGDYRIIHPTYEIQSTIIGRKPENGPQGSGISDDVSFTLTKTDQHGVAAPIFFEPRSPDGVPRIYPVEGASPTLNTMGGGQREPCITHDMAVRRLTPVECERLQGFPDNFTQIPWRNKPADECPDGPRYKALGNSMAVPNMRWIAERIERVKLLTSAN